MNLRIMERDLQSPRLGSNARAWNWRKSTKVGGISESSTSILIKIMILLQNLTLFNNIKSLFFQAFPDVMKVNGSDLLVNDQNK